MAKEDFPKIWVPSWENRDVRQLLWHRHRMVQTGMRIMDQLQATALNDGSRYKKKLWRVPFGPFAQKKSSDTRTRSPTPMRTPEARNWAGFAGQLGETFSCG